MFMPIAINDVYTNSN